MAGIFDTEYHERKIKEYQPPLSKLDKVINWESMQMLKQNLSQNIVSVVLLHMTQQR